MTTRRVVRCRSIGAQSCGGGWNYRVVRREHKVGKEIEVEFSIHEVYYDVLGSGPVAITSRSIGPGGSTRKELKFDVDRITLALSKPVLRYEDFEPGGKYFRE